MTSVGSIASLLPAPATAADAAIAPIAFAVDLASSTTALTTSITTPRIDRPPVNVKDRPSAASASTKTSAQLVLTARGRVEEKRVVARWLSLAAELTMAWSRSRSSPPISRPMSAGQFVHDGG